MQQSTSATEKKKKKSSARCKMSHPVVLQHPAPAQRGCTASGGGGGEEGRRAGSRGASGAVPTSYWTQTQAIPLQQRLICHHQINSSAGTGGETHTQEATAASLSLNSIKKNPSPGKIIFGDSPNTAPHSLLLHSLLPHSLSMPCPVPLPFPHIFPFISLY